MDNDEINTIVLTEGIRGNPTKVIVNASGLYCLTIRSDIPQAKLFRKWVISEVLPFICKTGSYTSISLAASNEQGPLLF